MAFKIVIALLVAVLLGGIVFGFYRATPATQPMNSSPIKTVTLGNATVAVEVEDTEASRQQGLSGRQSLNSGSGMLFVFDTPGHYGFWMKDMNFAIDMLFIDAAGKVVTIAANATPESYRQTPPQVFYPDSEVKFVLEVPAGFAATNNVTVGQTVQFK